MTPAAEVESLRGPAEHATLKPGQPHRIQLDTLRHELQLGLGLSSGKASVRLLTSGVAAWELAIDIHNNKIQCGDIQFPLPDLPWPRPSLRMFLDASIVECFIGGREALTSRVYALKPGASELVITVEGGKDAELTHWPLNAISPDRLTT
jgi:hypothetical protein